MAEHVCLLWSIAVTFGTLGKPLRKTWALESEIRSLSLHCFLSTKSETSHYLVVALNVCSLQIIEQTASLRDHLEQAAPRVIVLFVDFEVFGELVNTLA
jgi:hypothetical protein